MACDSFSKCVNDPLLNSGLGASTSFASLSSTAVFSMNLALYIFYIFLLVGVVMALFKAIYAIINADSADAFEKFRAGITNAVFAAIGIVLLFSVRFLFISILKLVGVEDADNVFMEAPMTALFSLFK